MTEPDDRPGSDDPEDPSELLRLIGRTVPRSPHATASPQVAPGAEDRAALEAEGPPAAVDDGATADAEPEPADPAGTEPGSADPAGTEPAVSGPAVTELAATGAAESPASGRPEPATATPVAHRPGDRDARSGPAEGGNVHPDLFAATSDTSADRRASRNGARDDACATPDAQDDRSERPGGRGSGHLDPATEPPGPGTGDRAAAGRTGATGAAVGPENVADAENAAEPEGPAGPEAPRTEDSRTEDFRTEDFRTEDFRTEDFRTEDPRTEDPRTEDPRAEEPGTGVPGTQDEPEPEEPEFHELADDTELEHALEALLLVVDAPVDEASLATALHQTPSRIRQTLHRMSLAYTADRRGIDLRRAGEGWRFYTRDRYAPYVEKMLMDGQRARLTRAALETLAVVAYRQPVTRARVSAVRGVNCDGVLRTLLTRGLVEEAGTEEHTGGTLFRTTELFLERLGISSVAELPPLAPLLPDIDAIDDLES